MKVKIVFAVLIATLIYTRFVNIGWGLPYPMHPDERNMAVAIQQLHCDFKFQIANFKVSDCFNPHFFAYGQLPLYIAYAGIRLFHTILGITGPPSFVEATVALRAISAMSSILLAFVLLKIIRLIYKPKQRHYDITMLRLFALTILIFQPYAIQFAHFGTTESLLMLLYSIIVYYSLYILKTADYKLPTVLLGVVLGLAIGTKSSSLLFFVVPTGVLLFKKKWKEVIVMFVLAIIFALVASPQSIIHWSEFKSSMEYESAVGLGAYKAFYTRQFENTTPVIFQLTHILPYALGLPIMIVGIGGLFFLSWKQKEYNVLRIALLMVFLPSAFFYAKWTRFIAPAFPILTVLGVMWIFDLFNKLHLLTFRRLIVLFITLLLCLHGVAYVSVYTNPDVRYSASEWIHRNIPQGSLILSETANVVDIPIPPPTYTKAVPDYRVIPFNFYDLDTNLELQKGLVTALGAADYIIIPSRRIFKNHPSNMYPMVADYYDDLFSGRTGFTQIGEIASYPKISLFGKTVWEWKDESAEETWTVFDHPVIRIYKRVESSKVIKSQSQDIQLDFSNYTTSDYRLSDLQTFRLLVADTPEKWEQGLMYVKTIDDIGGYDGMLFQFPDAEQRMFWNKNTVSDLTLYWVYNGDVIGTSNLPSIEKTGSIVTVSSPGPANEVIEILP